MKKTKDIINKKNNQSWLYSDTVKQHFFQPQNYLTSDPKTGEFDCLGEVGSPACGDVMKLWLKINPKNKKIIKVGWRTFGCASAIASTSMLSSMLLEKGGLNLDVAYKITPKDIIKRLGGLPDNKIHCSVLGDQALRKAIDDYYSKSFK